MLSCLSVLVLLMRCQYFSVRTPGFLDAETTDTRLLHVFLMFLYYKAN